MGPEPDLSGFLIQRRRRKEFLFCAGATTLEAIQTSVDEPHFGLCGGQGVCATCHIYVDPESVPHLPPPGEAEQDLLDGLPGRLAVSRIACQLRLAPSHRGIVVAIP